MLLLLPFLSQLSCLCTAQMQYNSSIIIFIIYKFIFMNTFPYKKKEWEKKDRSTTEEKLHLNSKEIIQNWYMRSRIYGSVISVLNFENCTRVIYEIKKFYIFLNLEWTNECAFIIWKNYICKTGALFFISFFLLSACALLKCI